MRTVEVPTLTIDEAMTRIQQHSAHLHEHKAEGRDGVVELLLWTNDIKSGHVWMDVEQAEGLVKELQQAIDSARSVISLRLT
jgi:hypothetical protein